MERESFSTPDKHSSRRESLSSECGDLGKFSSLDSELTDSEIEGERLQRKIIKNFSGRRSWGGNKDNLFDKLTRWNSIRKAERMRSRLADYIPRIKSIEQEVNCRISTVRSQESTIIAEANAILLVMEKQIEYFEIHTNHLDEAINDIRQCDFNVVKEITEMKNTFGFTQVRMKNNNKYTLPKNMFLI